MKEERRVRRSEIIDEALTFQFEASTERAGLKDMLLADQEGFLIATTQASFEESEDIAAALPLMVQGQHFTGEMIDLSGISSVEIAVSTFELDSTEFFLCALGNNDQEIFSELEHAKSGVLRILG